MKSVFLEILAATLFFFKPSFAIDQGLHLKLHRRNDHNVPLMKRGNFVGVTSLVDSYRIYYYLPITLGGIQFFVDVDTASSDLWIAGNVPNSTSTGSFTTSFVATGPIFTSTLDFGGYQIPNQAYIQTNSTGYGTLGIGPNIGSFVYSTLCGASGDPVINRVFEQYPIPNFMTILLDRNNPLDLMMTLGQVHSSYKAVISQPQLNVTLVPLKDWAYQSWQILLDPDGILGPDDQPLSLATVVNSTSNVKQLTVAFDTSSPCSFVPEYVANAIYKRIPGAQLVNRTDLGLIWQLPCDKEVNVTFIFGGKHIPMHPLDTNLDWNITDNNGNHVCLGAFQPLPISATTLDLYDIVLGVTFMYDAYMLIDYGNGDFETPNAFIQLLATTNNTAEAHMDFVNVRMNGQDSTNWTLLPPSLNGSPTAALATQSNFDRHVKHYAAIIGGIVGALLLSLIIWICCKSRSRKSFARPAFMSWSRGYHPLQDPAPQGADDLHLLHEEQQYSVLPPYSEK